MKIGYARVSTTVQDTQLQIAALKRAEVSVYWEEKISAVKKRPALNEMLRMLQPGDTVIVYKMDRLARSLQDLLRITAQIEAAGAALKSLTEPIETETSVGRMMFQLLGAFAEFERNVIRERCQAGREAAMARGVKFGAPRKLDYAKLVRMRNDGMSLQDIAIAERVTHVAIIKALRKARAEDPEGDPFGPGSIAAQPSPVGSRPFG